MNAQNPAMPAPRTLISLFVGDLKQEAAQHGHLDGERIEVLARKFLARIMPENASVATKEPAGKIGLDERGQRPFDRLLVTRFEHLLPQHSAEDEEEKDASLSRLVIPGLVTAISTVVGVDYYANCDRMTKAHAADYHRLSDGTVDWRRMAEEPEIARLIDEVLVILAEHFTDFEKRVRWLVETINRHLSATGEDPSWVMDTNAAHKLLEALYAGLRTRLHRDPRRLEMEVGPAATAIAALDMKLGR